MKISGYFSGFLLLATLFAVSAKDSHALKPGQVPCPVVIGTKSDKTFIPRKGKVCFSSKTAAKNAGYRELVASGDPKTVDNPELDTERVFTGRGDFTLAKAFRVTNVARVLNIELANCATDNVLFNFISLYDSSGERTEFKSVSLKSPVSVTVANPGLYGIKYAGQVLCDFRITVQ